MPMNCESSDKVRLYVVYNGAVTERDIPRTDAMEPLDSTCTDGIHIAQRQNYCELRAHYYVWKNMRFHPLDRVGFFHYRRYLDFGQAVCIPGTSGLRPYRLEESPDPELYSGQRLRGILRDFDVIAPLPEYTGQPVWRRYAGRHRLEEIQAVRSVIAARQPAYLPACDRYLNGSAEYYCNMFVMRWEIYCRYCEWLFDLLDCVEKRLGNTAGAETFGCLGERLFGVYYTELKKERGVRCGELPRVHFWAYDDAAHHFRRSQVLYRLLPPGTRRRNLVSGLIRKGGC